MYSIYVVDVNEHNIVKQGKGVLVDAVKHTYRQRQRKTFKATVLPTTAVYNNDVWGNWGWLEIRLSYTL